MKRIVNLAKAYYYFYFAYFMSKGCLRLAGQDARFV